MLLHFAEKSIRFSSPLVLLCQNSSIPTSHRNSILTWLHRFTHNFSTQNNISLIEPPFSPKSPSTISAVFKNQQAPAELFSALYNSLICSLWITSYLNLPWTLIHHSPPAQPNPSHLTLLLTTLISWNRCATVKLWKSIHRPSLLDTLSTVQEQEYHLGSVVSARTDRRISYSKPDVLGATTTGVPVAGLNDFQALQYLQPNTSLFSSYSWPLDGMGT